MHHKCHRMVGLGVMRVWSGHRRALGRHQGSPWGRITHGDFPGIDIRGKSEEPAVPSLLKLGHWDENISWYRDERPNPKVKDWNGPESYRDGLRKDQAQENGFG